MSRDMEKVLKEIERFGSRIRDTKIEEKEKELSKRGVEISEKEIETIFNSLNKRFEHISANNLLTVNESKEQVKDAMKLLCNWMLRGTNVRIIGAGRAKLAGTLPANRLAHGGAHVSVEGSVIPMPHSITAGGIIAVSASGKTVSVIDVMKKVKKERPSIKILGIAAHNALEFKDNCHIFIGIKVDSKTENPLKALADIEEIVILEVLDALIVGAGKLAGFDDAKWRLGHEDIGPTGPYDVSKKAVYHFVSDFFL